MTAASQGADFVVRKFDQNQCPIVSMNDTTDCGTLASTSSPREDGHGSLNALAPVTSIFGRPVTQKSKKYTIYFYKSSVPNVHPFADPTQEFLSLDEARTFAQNAAAMSLVEIAYSFRIESDDRRVNELWTRTESGWKLHFQKGEI